MPQFTIAIAEHLIPGLQTVVERYNKDTGSDLSVTAWITLHVQELAVAEQLVAEQTRLQQQSQTDLVAALTAVRDRLIAGEPNPATGGDA